VPGWIWLVCGLAIGAFVMFLMNLEPGRDDIQRAKAEPAPVSKPKTGTPPATQPKYDFYTLLPESEVIVPTEAVPEQAPPTVSPAQAAQLDAARAEAALSGKTPPPALATAPTTATAPPATPAKAPTSTQFFLQAGSFRKQSDADKVRAQITLLGQSVRIESGIVRDETWYRVLVGPFSSREPLSQAQKQLANNGFRNLLLQQRQNP
jgi:cell division protein FtsN